MRKHLGQKYTHKYTCGKPGTSLPSDHFGGLQTSSPEFGAQYQNTLKEAQWQQSFQHTSQLNNWRFLGGEQVLFNANTIYLMHFIKWPQLKTRSSTWLKTWAAWIHRELMKHIIEANAMREAHSPFSFIRKHSRPFFNTYSTCIISNVIWRFSVLMSSLTGDVNHCWLARPPLSIISKGCPFALQLWL